MIGVSSDGQFRTAKLKEYPAALSAGLAQTICDFLQVTTHREVQVHDEEWEAWYIKARATLAEIRSDARMQPDLQLGGGMPRCLHVFACFWLSIQC